MLFRCSQIEAFVPSTRVRLPWRRLPGVSSVQVSRVPAHTNDVGGRESLSAVITSGAVGASRISDGRRRAGPPMALGPRVRRPGSLVFVPLRAFGSAVVGARESRGDEPTEWESTRTFASAGLPTRNAERMGSRRRAPLQKASSGSLGRARYSTWRCRSFGATGGLRRSSSVFENAERLEGSALSSLSRTGGTGHPPCDPLVAGDARLDGRGGVVSAPGTAIEHVLRKCRKRSLVLGGATGGRPQQWLEGRTEKRTFRGGFGGWLT